MDQEVLKTNLNGLERKILVLLNEHKSVKNEVTGLKSENLELKKILKRKVDEYIKEIDKCIAHLGQ